MGREKTGGSRAVKPFLSPSGGGCPSGGGGLNPPQERIPYNFFNRNKKILKSLGFYDRIRFYICRYPPCRSADRTERIQSGTVARRQTFAKIIKISHCRHPAIIIFSQVSNAYPAMITRCSQYLTLIPANFSLICN